MPLIIQNEHSRLQPPQPTTDARLLSHDATVSVISDQTVAVTADAAAAGNDYDEDTRDAGQYRQIYYWPSTHSVGLASSVVFVCRRL